MYYRVSLILAFCCLPQLAAGQSNDSVIVRLAPAVVDVQVGDIFTIDLLADLGAHSVIGWGLDLGYDDLALAPVGPPEIGPLWTASFAPDGDGLTGFSRAWSTSGESVLLARLTYQALSPGETQLVPSYTSADLNEGFPLDPVGFANITFEPGMVNVVPEPAACLLLTALAALAVTRRGARSQ